MRNSVIRKKLLKEQSIIRRLMHYPQRFIVPKVEWTEANERQMQVFAREASEGFGRSVDSRLGEMEAARGITTNFHKGHKP